MMKRLKFKIPEEAQSRIVYGLGTQYPNPLNALREYLTNAIDAVEGFRKQGLKEGLVKTLIIPEERRICVYDNGLGMSVKKLESLPENVGLSEKFDKVDQRGEKAVGLLAFASMGTRLHVVSKREEDTKFGYLRYEARGDELIPDIGEVSQSDMRDTFYGAFKHGTRIVVDCNPQIIAKNLTGELVEDFVQKVYLPLLRRREINMQISDSKSGYSRKIRAPTIGDDMGMVILLKENLSFQVNRSRQTEDFNFFANIVFDPEMDNGLISVHSKDVRVYESALQLEESLKKLDFWKCRQITGFLNVPDLRLTLGRDGINRATKQYQGFIEKLEEIHERFWPQIKGRIEQRKVDLAEKVVRESWKEFEKAYEVTEPLNKQKRIRDPNSEPRQRPNKPGTPQKRRKRRLNFGQPRVYEFSLSDKHLRAKLEDSMGEPAVGVNSGHKDYLTFVKAETDLRKQREYVFDVAAHPIAEHEAREEIARGGTLGDPFEMAAQIERRAQDLKMSILRRKRKKGSK